MRKGEYIYYEWFFYHTENGERIELDGACHWSQLESRDILSWKNHKCIVEEGVKCVGEIVLMKKYCDETGVLDCDYDGEAIRDDGTLPSHFYLPDDDLEADEYDDNGELIPREKVLDRDYVRIPKYIHKHLEKIRSK
jgi:hypothetical protein